VREREKKKRDKSKLRRCAVNERKKKRTRRAERKVILAVETERGHYALDAPEMSRADESFSSFFFLSLSVIFLSMFFLSFMCLPSFNGYL
jgi:hypothetical protein